jgi:hypothetical protein
MRGDLRDGRSCLVSFSMWGLSVQKATEIVPSPRGFGTPSLKSFDLQSDSVRDSLNRIACDLVECVVGESDALSVLDTVSLEICRGAEFLPI